MSHDSDSRLLSTQVPDSCIKSEHQESQLMQNALSSAGGRGRGGVQKRWLSGGRGLLAMRQG